MRSGAQQTSSSGKLQVPVEQFKNMETMNYLLLIFGIFSQKYRYKDHSGHLKVKIILIWDEI